MADINFKQGEDGEKNYAVITGAGSGLGKSIAFELASRGFDILLVSLADSNLSDTQQELVALYPKLSIESLGIDLTHTEAPALVTAKAKSLGGSIQVLINNVGIGGTMPFDVATTSQVEQMLSLNVRCTTLLAHYFIPLLIQNPKSYMLNISSVAAFNSVPMKTIYPASKSYVSFFSQTLHAEFKDRGLSVTVAYPGPMLTSESIKLRIAAWGWFGRKVTLSVSEVANVTLNAMFAGKMFVTPGLAPKITRFVTALIPINLLNRITLKMLRKEYYNNF
jgi:uncharacterized protein